MLERKPFISIFGAGTRSKGEVQIKTTAMTAKIY